MGIDAPALALLCGAKSMGAEFSSTAMIGRQNFTGEGTEGAIARVFSVLGVGKNAAKFLREHHFCEELFRLLGANEVSSFDASEFENATNIHDMNLPIPAAWHERFSCVYDGGTIEHVFNLPLALKN